MKKDRVFIRLSDIPEEGRAYSYDRKSGELDLALKDLIDDNPYEINFFIRPTGNVFDLSGKLSTTLTRVCSKCGEDLTIAVNAKIHEILMDKPEEEKGDTQSKSGFLAKNAEESLGVTYVIGGVLNGENMLHEIVGLSDPAYPKCEKENCDEEIQNKLKELERAAEMALQGKATAFEVLKSLKLQ